MRIGIFYLAVFLALAGLVFSPVIPAEESLTQGQPESTANKSLQALAQAFFEWRSVQQPVQGDDIPRVERPDGWVPDVSPAAIESDIAEYTLFLQAVDNLDTSDWSITDRVDARLLRAAIQRVYWELEILKLPRKNPLFYLDQTLGSVFELLVLSSPMTESRANNIILRLENIPETTRHAKKNLDLAHPPVRPGHH